jgi:2-dehydro-3-deoxygluconokinase
LIELVTLGETMAAFTPASSGPLRYVSDYHMRIAGAESNLAIGIQKLGHSAGWISKLGDDEFGHFILNSIRAEGVDTSQVIFDSRHRSGIMFKETNFNSETKVSYYRDNSAASCISASELDSSYVADAQILHLTGITPVLSSSCLEAVIKSIDIAKQNNRLVSFDPNIRLKLWNGTDYSDIITEILFRSDIISCGVGEADLLFQTRDVNEIFKMIFGKGEAKFVAIKDGANGAWVGTKDVVYNIPPTKWNRVDAVGAGDAFNAGFITGILEGLPIETCGKMGNIMGGLAIQTFGDIEALPTREELNNYLNNTQIIYR